MSYTGRNTDWSSQASCADAVLTITDRLPQRRRSNTRTRSSNRSRGTDFPIIVHCHLCWDWVWQRPQQFLSRLSQRHRILFVEVLGPDPELLVSSARLKTVSDFPNISILRMQFPASRWNDGEFIDAERLRLLQGALRGPLSGEFKQPVQWFYDPMAVTAFSGKIGEAATVYDCMDELSQFRFAPPELKRRELELLRRADVVFTGGRRLYEAKRQHHPNCHFYGCGVDIKHFGQAREAATQVPPELADLPRPVFGYFGVIDERIDYELIGKLADATPHGSVVMVGPVMKVDEKALPRRSNLHWLGRRDYADLPRCVKGFDVCLMPFALNEATEFINPTKSLEYMASGRTIISSAVPDVISNFGEVVQVAENHDHFLALAAAAAQAPEPPRIERGVSMAQANSWESIVARLEEHIQAVLPRGLGQRKHIRMEVAHGDV